MNEADTARLASRDNAIAILNDAFADRFHSWAGYILEAGPYVGEEDTALRRTMERIAKADRAAAERLADVIEGLDGIPQVPAYPHRIAELNYLSLEYLRNVIREELTRQLKTYERQLPLLHDCAAARNVLYAICQTLRTHIVELT